MCFCKKLTSLMYKSFTFVGLSLRNVWQSLTNFYITYTPINYSLDAISKTKQRMNIGDIDSGMWVSRSEGMWECRTWVMVSLYRFSATPLSSCWFRNTRLFMCVCVCVLHTLVIIIRMGPLCFAASINAPASHVFLDELISISAWVMIVVASVW